MADEIHGRDLVVGDMFGYACPTHGLMYAQRSGPEIGALYKAHPELPTEAVSGVLVCQQCRGPLGGPSEQPDPCNEMLVPAAALGALRELASRRRWRKVGGRLVWQELPGGDG